MYFIPADFTLEEVPRLVGIIGFLMYVGNYTCLSFGIVTSESLRYFVVNTCAAGMVLISLTHDFNLAAMLIQVFFVTIGSCAILIRLRRRARFRRHPQAIG